VRQNKNYTEQMY